MPNKSKAVALITCGDCTPPVEVWKGPGKSYIIRTNGGGRGNVHRVSSRAELGGWLAGWIDPEGDPTP